VRRFNERLRYRCLSLFLAVQVFVIFGIGPLLSVGLEVSPSLAGFILIALILLVIVMAARTGPIVAAVGALLLNTTAEVLLRTSELTHTIIGLDALGSTLSIIALSWVVVEVVFAPGRIDGHRIVGAVVLYLNASLLFQIQYRLIAQLVPGSFTGLPLEYDRMRSYSDLIYFSMTTLTTVGYGDITPVHPIARSLSNMEGLVGQLYPAIILARLMTLYKPGD
jgi:hypothetical protein